MTTCPPSTAVPDDPPTGTEDQDDDGGGLVSLERAERPPAVDHELTITPGAGPHDVAAHLLKVPADAAFVDMYGDVDLTVVFREADRAA